MIDEKELRKNIGQKIRDIRNDKGLTQSEVAERVGLSEKYIYQVESAKENISLTTLIKMANFFEEDLEYFISTGHPNELESKIKILPKRFQKTVENLVDDLLKAVL